MPLFKIQNNKLSKVSSTQRLEKELQNLIENNLDEVLDIHFLASEFTTSFGGRIDTLGIDRNGSPVIIEYKRNTNDNVINQALSYLRWLLDHKAEFERLVEQKSGKDAGVDWNSPRVICIAESYNKFDLDTVDILPINIELLRYRIYENDALLLDAEGYQKVNISTSGIFKKSDKQQKPIRLQKEYSVDELFKGNWEESRELFNHLREKILGLDKNITEKITKLYIAYKLENNFCEIVPQAKGLRVHLDIPHDKITSQKFKVDDISEKGHWATGNTRFYLESINELEEAMELIKQSYNFSL